MSTNAFKRYDAVVRKKTYSLYRVKCKHCWGRRTLKKHPDLYVSLPKCCDHTDYWIDWYRTALKEGKRRTCTCLGMPYPHKRGSKDGTLGAMCDYRSFDEDPK